MKKLKTVNEYISSLPKSSKSKIIDIRRRIKKEAPKAEELLSYQMPAFKLNKRILVYYAAWKEHVALYAYPSSVTKFKKELSKYKTSKSTVQFRLDKPLPLNLIKKMIRFRVKENLEKAKNEKR